MRNRAYRLFTTPSKHPLEEEELLSCSAYTIVDEKRMKDPFGHIAAWKTGGFLFTFPVYDELKKDQLELLDERAEPRDIWNFHGKNHTSVVDELERRRKASLPHLDKLKEELPAGWMDAFKKDFEKLPGSHQKSITDEFLKAKENAFQAGDTGPGVKHLCSLNGHALYELKIFKPAPVRVFFTLMDSRVIIDSLFKGKSGSGKSQDAAIREAKKRLSAL